LEQFILLQFHAIWNNLEQFAATFATFATFVWVLLQNFIFFIDEFGAIWGNLRQFAAILSNFGQFEAI